MKVRPAAVGVALVVVICAAVFLTRDFGKHEYHPPPGETWINVSVGATSMKETVLWNPVSGEPDLQATLTCLTSLDANVVAETREGEMSTRTYAYPSTEAVELHCDAKSMFGGDRPVSIVRVLAVTEGDDSATVLSSDPTPSEVNPPIWRLTPGQPVLKATVSAP